MRAKSIGLATGILAMSLAAGGDAYAHDRGHRLCTVHGHYGAERTPERYRTYYYTTLGRVYFKQRGDRRVIYGRVQPPSDWVHGTVVYREPVYTTGVTVHRGQSVRVHTHC